MCVCDNRKCKRASCLEVQTKKQQQQRNRKQKTKISSKEDSELVKLTNKNAPRLTDAADAAVVAARH